MAEANQRVIKTGLDAKFTDMLNAVVGQLSDGYWENSPRMEGYWHFAEAKSQGGEAVLLIDKDYSTRGYGKTVYNLFANMDDAKVKTFFADKIKFLVKEEGLKWNRGNKDQTSDYLSYDDDYTVSECYYAYEILKGRNADRHAEYSEDLGRGELERRWSQMGEQASKACEQSNQSMRNLLDEADKQIQAAGYARLGSYTTTDIKNPDDADGTYVEDWRDYGNDSYFGYKYDADPNSDADYDRLAKLAQDNGLVIVDADEGIVVGYAIEVPEVEDLEDFIDGYADYMNDMRKDDRFEAYYASKDGKDYQVAIRIEDGEVSAPKKCTVTVNGEEETLDVVKDDDSHYKKTIAAGLKKMGYKMNEERMSYDQLKADALKRLGDGTYTDETDLDDSIYSTLDAMPYDIGEGTRQALASDLFEILYDKIEESKAGEAKNYVDKGDGVFVQLKTPKDYERFVKTALDWDDSGEGGDFLEENGYRFEDIKDCWWEIAPEELERIPVPASRGKGARYLDGLGKDAKLVYIAGDRLYTTDGVRRYIEDDLGVDLADYGLEDEDEWEARKRRRTGKKSESNGWGDWEDVTGLEEAIDKIDKLAYELRNCVRGAYTRCHTWSELADHIKGLGAELIDAGDNASYMQDESRKR